MSLLSRKSPSFALHSHRFLSLSQLPSQITLTPPRTYTRSMSHSTPRVLRYFILWPSPLWGLYIYKLIESVLQERMWSFQLPWHNINSWWLNSTLACVIFEWNKSPLKLRFSENSQLISLGRKINLWYKIYNRRIVQ